MSIIYDALKKVDQSNINPDAQPPQQNKNKKSSFKVYLLYILILAIGVFAANIFFKFFLGPSHGPSLKTPAALALPPVINATEQLKSENQAANTTVKEETPAPSLALSGTFFSADKGYALINNKILAEGDSIEGATVVRIGMDEVELKFKDSTIKISRPK